jgi:hypothetical protein
MSLERKAIREAVAGLLLGKTNAGAKVYTDRTRPLEFADLPCLVVWTKAEKSEIFNQAPREYMRTLVVSVQIFATADDGAVDQLDLISEQVEQVIGQNDLLTFNGENTACDTRIIGGEGEYTSEGEQLLGWWRIDIEADYRKYSPSEISENLGDLEGVDIKYDCAPADGRLEAEDQINLPK